MGQTESYVYISFFKCWFGIILYCFLLSFFLTPVLLSAIGPETRIFVADQFD